MYKFCLNYKYMEPETYIYNYGENYNIVEKVDNKELFYYLILEFESGAKYVSKPFFTHEEALKHKTEKFLYQKEPFIIKKYIIIQSTEAMMFKYYDVADCIKIK